MFHKMLRVSLCVFLLLAHHSRVLAQEVDEPKPSEDGAASQGSGDNGHNEDDNDDSGDDDNANNGSVDHDDGDRLEMAQGEERKAREKEGNKPQEGSAEDLADKAARGEEGAAEALDKWKQEDESRKAADREGRESGDEAAAQRAEIQERIDRANDELDQIRKSGEGDFEEAWKKADEANRDMEKALNISNPNRKEREGAKPDQPSSGDGSAEDSAQELYKNRKTNDDTRRAWQNLKQSDPEAAQAAKKSVKAEKKRGK